MKANRGVEVYIYSFINLGARWGGWSTPRPGRFTPGKSPISIVQEAGWASQKVCMGAENIALTGIRSPDRPARQQVAMPAELSRLQSWVQGVS